MEINNGREELLHREYWVRLLSGRLQWVAKNKIVSSLDTEWQKKLIKFLSSNHIRIIRDQRRFQSSEVLHAPTD